MKRLRSSESKETPRKKRKLKSNELSLTDLPEEVLFLIMDFKVPIKTNCFVTTFKALVTILLTCKRFYTLFNNSCLWLNVGYSTLYKNYYANKRSLKKKYLPIIDFVENKINTISIQHGYTYDQSELVLKEPTKEIIEKIPALKKYLIAKFRVHNSKVILRSVYVNWNRK